MSMRKNIVHNVKKVSSRNQMIDALQEKQVVIEPVGEFHSQLMEEIEKSIGDRAKGKKTFGLGIVVWIIGSAIAVPISALGTAIAIGGKIKENSGDYKKYKYVFIKDRVLLVRKNDYDCKLDSIKGMEKYILSEKGNKCPVCGEKTIVNEDNTEYRCQKCGKQILSMQ